jgi:hypothetical protein
MPKEGSMKWYTLERVWSSSGKKNHLKVRFNDWTHQIKYFEIMGESSDGKRFVGTLDNGEKMSFSKNSRGWNLYTSDDEYQAKAV